MEPIVLRSQTVVLSPLSADHAAALAEAAAESRDQFQYTRVPNGVVLAYSSSTWTGV